MRCIAGLIVCLVLLLSLDARADTPQPCGLEAPCVIEGGQYYLGFPDDWDGTPVPGIVFFHGHRSSGQSSIKSGTLKRVFRDQGYLLISPDGTERAPGIKGWSGRIDNPVRNDIDFVRRVLDDVGTRVALRRDQILVSGFSSGGSMAWMLACFDGGHYRAFAPVAGALRIPNPLDDGCPSGPVSLIHFHGFADKQVPIEGRGIRDWHQGDVFASMALARRANQTQSQPSGFEINDQFRCRFWTGGDGELELCLHNGGHGLPKGWAERTHAWFERLIAAP